METLRFLMATTFYPPYHLGGDAVHVQYLAEALAARGHEVHVEFSPAAYRLKGGGSPRPEEGDGGVELHAIPSPFGRAQPAAAYLTGRSRGISRFHADLCREIRPDVVHLHNISLLGRGVLGVGASGLTLYTAHDYWVRCPRSDLVKYGRRPCDAPSCISCCLVSRKLPQMWRLADPWQDLQGLDFAIAPSQYMAHAVGPYLRCPVLHIPHFAPDPNPAEAAVEPGDYYLFVGAFEPHKGVLQLAEAAARLPGCRVRFAGRGSLTARLEEMRRAGSPNIEVEGWLSHDQLGRLYRGAKALILPSTGNENAPLVALEALAWGTPLLASRRGGLEELLHDGAAGRAFEPTTEDIAQAIARFEAEDLPRRLRPSSRSAYVGNHRPEKYLERYLDAVRNPDRLSPTSAEVDAVPEDPHPSAVGAFAEADLP